MIEPMSIEVVFTSESIASGGGPKEMGGNIDVTLPAKV